MKKRNRLIIITIFTILLLLGYYTHIVSKIRQGDKWKWKIKKLVKNGGVLVWDRSKKSLFALNPEEKFIPASILKVATALAAFNFLSESYSFPTALFMDSNNNLYIKGFGNPHLISEEIDVMCDRLHDTGVRKINSIYLDDTYFDGLIHVPGTGGSLNPYDALNGALIANFNTINIRVDHKGTISSAEEQTPLTPYARKAAKGLGLGRHRINLVDDPENSLLYAGELFAAILAQKGVTRANGVIKRKKVPSDLSPLFIHTSSKSLPDVIRDMMKYSNNFIANQLMLTIGAKQQGEPATIEKGVRVIDTFLREQIKIEDFSLSEGSGLSRNNRFSPLAMQKILYAFFPYKDLLNSKDGVFSKTGTLTGTSSLVGYYKNEKNQYRQFVIMLNQKSNNRDKILKLLKENL